MDQWLRPHILPNAGGLGLIPDPGTRFHSPQLKIPTRQQDPTPATKALCSQINTSKNKKGTFPERFRGLGVGPSARLQATSRGRCHLPISRVTSCPSLELPAPLTSLPEF